MDVVSQAAAGVGIKEKEEEFAPKEEEEVWESLFHFFTFAPHRAKIEDNQSKEVTTVA